MNAVVLQPQSDAPGFLRMNDVALAGRRVLMRVDLNVPLHQGRVAADHRIRACVPTIRFALGQGAAVILISHLGRPDEGRFTAEFSLAPVARRLETLLGVPVRFASHEVLGEVAPGEVVLLENIRFSRGEKSNDPEFAASLASLCDVFVMDAFGCAHRRHASTHGVVRYAAVACAGPLLCAEVEAFSRIAGAIEHPAVAVIGGSKVSTKLGTLEVLCEKIDCLVPGGGIANTLLVAEGHDVGASLYEPGSVEDAGRLCAKLRACGTQLLLPDDVVCAPSPTASDPVVRGVDEVAPGELIFDVGPRTRERIKAAVKSAAMVLWNGPIGVFERAPFAGGTRSLAQAIAAGDAYSVAGGGDTLAAIEQFGAADGISCISTGGGALLEFIEKGDLPALAALRDALKDKGVPG